MSPTLHLAERRIEPAERERDDAPRMPVRFSPTLVHLVERARAPRTESVEQERDDAQPRREMAIGVHYDRGSFGGLAWLLWLASFICLGVFRTTGGSFSTAEIIALAIFVGLAVVCMIANWVTAQDAASRRAAAVEEEIHWATTHPFEIIGYRAWLASDVSRLTLTLRGEVETGLVAEALRTIDPKIETTVIDAATFSLLLPPRMNADDGSWVRFCNVPLLERVFGQLVLPLHHEVGVERVTMG